MIKCKYEGAGIWNGRCVGTKEVDPCPGYNNCKQYKPNYMTNADRIRAMSDEGLSVWLMRLHTICECCSAKEECNTIEKDEVCRRGVLEWLKKIAEGE